MAVAVAEEAFGSNTIVRSRVYPWSRSPERVQVVMPVEVRDELQCFST